MNIRVALCHKGVWSQYLPLSVGYADQGFSIPQENSTWELLCPKNGSQGFPPPLESPHTYPTISSECNWHDLSLCFTP